MLRMNVRARLWLYEGPGGWHFVTLPAARAKEIRTSTSGRRRGWGSIPVTVSIGSSTWKTSLFPDRKSSSYVLPVKAEVRRKENLAEGNRVTMKLEVHV
ncbi:MAG: hypothetical protein HBSIN02_23130 [Bacteroidia bacterium]|nr:MAG: hypothetical protein HBSIN02_23130 [Bacteroidia bacterium]